MIQRHEQRSTLLKRPQPVKAHGIKPLKNVVIFSMPRGATVFLITQKHYSAWVRSRQQQLENDVSRVGDFDPLVGTLSTEKGTSEVHIKDEVVN